MDEKTIKTYNQKAEEYKSETDDFWARFPSDFVEIFIKSLNGKKVIDIGSGPGRDAEIFLKASLDVTCVDASESMIALTTQKGIKSILADFHKIPFEDGSLDGVWAYTSLLHLSKNDIPQAFKEMFRVLSKGGVIGIGLIEGQGEEERLSMGEDYPRLFSYFTRKEVEDLASAYNLEEVYFGDMQVGKRKYLHFLFRKI